MTNSDLKTRLKLAIALLRVQGVGNMRYSRLIRKFGDVESIVNAPIDKIAEISGISRGLASTIKNEIDYNESEKIAEKIIQLGWKVFFQNDDNYPTALKEISDAPPILFCEGTPHSDDDKLIAIVGTRKPSENGKLFAYNLATTLAREGVTIVSGMAEGIDSAAHRGALDAGGRTIAIWGNSLDMLFPVSNKKLAEEIKSKGAVFSEYLPGTRPDPVQFPQRNRIISGLSIGVIVIEAGEKSGALITASHALEQGREIFAVPGAPDSLRSKGVNNLIKKGARLLTSAEDVFEEIPQLKSGVLVKKFKEIPDLTEMERKIIEQFSEGPLQIDQLSRGASLPVSELMEFLLAMEMKGVVRELPGKRFVLSEEYQ